MTDTPHLDDLIVCPTCDLVYRAPAVAARERAYCVRCHTVLIALTTIPNRQILMPAINRATDAGAKTRFKWLHGASVLVTLAHIGLAGYALTRFLPGA